MVRIYKQSNNGQVGVLTDCLDADTFRSQLASAMAIYALNHCDDGDNGGEGELERDFGWLVGNAFEIYLKLKGYKSDGVSEQRLMFAGDRMPSPTEVPRAEALG